MYKKSNTSISRRNILKAGASAALFSMSGLTLFSPRVNAATITYNFVAESYVKTMVDGVNITAWRFRDLGGTTSGPGDLSAGIVAQSGDTIVVNLTNNLTTSIQFDMPGVLENQAVINPGTSITYNIAAPEAGSYLFRDNKNAEFGQAMGLIGPMVILPSNGSQTLYDGGPAFDRQYTLVLNDFDDRLNSATANGQSYDLNNFEANYYFVNGLSYANTSSDVDTILAMSMGEDVAIRFINGGLLTHSMHFHGYHVKVISRDRMPVTDIIDKDTVVVNPGECVDVILPVNQLGKFPLHTHYIPAVTADGVYVNPYGGALLILDAT
jgi:FtsP/CotA-like multicopper oxidase with cupredoxin domain